MRVIHLDGWLLVYLLPMGQSGPLLVVANVVGSAGVFSPMPLEIVAFRAKKLRKTMLSMRVTTVRMMPKMVRIGGVVKMD